MDTFLSENLVIDLKIKYYVTWRDKTLVDSKHLLKTFLRRAGSGLKLCGS